MFHEVAARYNAPCGESLGGGRFGASVAGSRRVAWRRPPYVERWHMNYALAADALLVLHAAFVAFVVFGGLLALRWRWLAWVHLPAAAWGVLIEAFGWTCPLTPLEWRWRAAAGEAGFSGSFIERHLVLALYPPGLTRATQALLAAGLLLGNVAIYTIWLKRRRAKRT